MSGRRAAVAAAVAVFIAAAVVVVWRAPGGSEPMNGATTPTTIPHSDESQVNSEPVTEGTDEPTETLTHLIESPEQAAVRFLELTEVVVKMTPAEAAQVQRSVASAASAERLATSVLVTMADLQAEFPEGIDVDIAPLGVSSEPVGDAWLVEVWYAAVAVYGEIAAVERWETATYRVVLEDGEWRMDDLVTVEGPVPIRPDTLFATPTDVFIAGTARFSDEAISP